MNDFALHTMEKVVAFVGEPDDDTRRDVREILGQAGLKQVSTPNTLQKLITMMEVRAPDLLLLADDLDPGIFNFIRDIRHNKVGTNPFVTIITLVRPDNMEAVKRAMKAGTDDIIIKPVKDEDVLQRLKRSMINRPAFVVASDYIGPDRRGQNRASAIRRISVPNIMLEKANGRDMDAGAVRQLVDAAMNDLLHARLESDGYRVSFVCRLVLEAYGSGKVIPEVQERLQALSGILKDTAQTAERLEEPQLAALCGALTGDVAAIAERYTAPTQQDLDLLQKLSKAVVSAVKPRTTPDKLGDETSLAAEATPRRDRAGFVDTKDPQRSADEASVVTMDEPVIEILPLAKGQFLFRQGDAATSAYILNNGAIGIFKEVDGKRVPIARVKKGEFFGEMAIIDGRARRNSAMALEDCTLSLVSKDMIEEKLSHSDSLIRTLLHMLSNSMRMVHEAYAPKGRNLTDSVKEMKEQARYIQRQIEAGSPERRKDGAAVAKKMNEIVDSIVKLVESTPDVDRRTPAVATEKDLGD